MKPMMGLVALFGSLAGCAPESACAEGEVCGRVVEGEDARLSKDAVSLDVAVFWHHDDVYARQLYAPMVLASVSSNVPVDFSGALPDAPDDDGLIQIEDPDPDVGVVTDPDAPFVGVGAIYVTSAGAVEDEPERLQGLDQELVLGMVREMTLFYTPVDLDSPAGIRGLWNLLDDEPIGAGYHLYFGAEEVDLNTPVEAELGYVAD